MTRGLVSVSNLMINSNKLTEMLLRQFLMSNVTIDSAAVACLYKTEQNISVDKVAQQQSEKAHINQLGVVNVLGVVFEPRFLVSLSLRHETR